MCRFLGANRINIIHLKHTVHTLNLKKKRKLINVIANQMQKLVNTFVILVGDIVKKITEMQCSFSFLSFISSKVKTLASKLNK